MNIRCETMRILNWTLTTGNDGCRLRASSTIKHSATSRLKNMKMAKQKDVVTNTGERVIKLAYNN